MSHLPTVSISCRNPHLLETVDGLPFFLLGDTGWEMFHRLTLDEIEHYFKVRSSQGFNMVWANLLPEFDGLRTPNRYGDVPLHEADPTQPNEGYFLFVDKVLDLAEELGIYLGLLPAWGDKLTAPWGVGPRIFGDDNLADAFEYSRWLGNRYAKRTNIMWVLGGDRPPRLFGESDHFPRANAKAAGLSLDSDWTSIWRVMADGIKAGGAEQLMTYHPQGGTASSSVFLHDEPWLDINAIQSGHGGGHDVPIWESVERDYELKPPKPTMDAEPNYEDHPVNPWPVWNPADGFFNDYDVRKQIYRSIFAGGCGAVYGNHCVWQFASDRNPPVLEVLNPWQKAILSPGACQIKHLRILMESVDFLGLVPDQSRILSSTGGKESHTRAIRSESETLVYVPDNRELEIDLRWAKSDAWNIEEFNPRSGEVKIVNDAVIQTGSVICPGNREMNDRIIVLRKS